MRALVIAPQPFFSPRGTPFSVYYRTLVTAECGVHVDLLTYGQGEDIDIPAVRIIRIPRLGLLGPVKVGPSSCSSCGPSGCCFGTGTTSCMHMRKPSSGAIF
jgi:hypothetical protein